MPAYAGQDLISTTIVVWQRVVSGERRWDIRVFACMPHSKSYDLTLIRYVGMSVRHTCFCMHATFEKLWSNLHSIRCNVILFVLCTLQQRWMKWHTTKERTQQCKKWARVRTEVTLEVRTILSRAIFNDPLRHREMLVIFYCAYQMQQSTILW